jgi:pilus assembly protein CpaF
MNTGHDGSMSTVHANSSRDALARVETMVLMAGFELPARAIRQQIASALDLIIQIERMHDGSRRVSAITEVLHMEGDVITTQDLFRFEYAAGAGGRGELKNTNLRPGCKPKFDRHGLDLPGARQAAPVVPLAMGGGRK